MKNLHKTVAARDTEVQGAIWRLLSGGQALSMGQISARLPSVYYHEIDSALRTLLHLGSIGVVDRCFYLRKKVAT